MNIIRASINNIIVKEAINDIGINEISGNKGWKPRFELKDLINPDKDYTESEILNFEMLAELEEKYIKDFTSKMKSLGWKSGWAWCLFWAETVWLRSYSQYNSFIESKLEKLILGSATGTWSNFKKESKNSNIILSKEPVKGAIAIWQKFKDNKADWRGHGAIVYGWTDTTIKTIDGNSNSKGGREGIEIAKIERPLNFNEDNGLRLLGFIHPPQ